MMGQQRVPAAAQSTEQLLTQWSTWMAGEGCARTTIDARTTRVRKLADWTGRPAEIADADQVMAYVAGVEHPSTRATYYAHLRAWFRWLVRAGHRADDPTQRLKAPKAPRREPHPVADKHMQALLGGTHRTRTHAMILLAALAGLRVHEIAKIRGEDLDLVANTLTVTGKGGVTVRLPLHPMLARFAGAMPRRGWWFPAPRMPGRPPAGHIHGRSVTDVVRIAMRRAGVPGSAHSLRHWYGTTLVDSGADLRTTQTLLRHASLATTQIYTRVNDRQRRDAVALLDPLRAARTA